MQQQSTQVAPFRDELDTRNADIWEAIFELRFLQGLRDSSLSRDRFAYFIEQDLLYLDEFARVLALGAARSPSAEVQEIFLRHAQTVHLVEQQLHTTLAPELGLSPETMRERDPAPVTLSYTDHLRRVAYSEGLPELVAAILPCYDVYRRVGGRLQANPPADEMYAQWVASYASPEFVAAVEEQLSLLDALAAVEGAPTRMRMAARYRTSIRYEWMFWQQAYDLLEWPVGADQHLRAE